MIRNFLENLPAACGVPKELAKIEADHMVALFDFERANPGSLLSRNSFKSVDDRIHYGLKWLRFADPDKVQYAVDLLIYAAKSIDANGKGVVVDGLAEDRDMLLTDEPDYPEISALMSVDQAGTLSNWA